jgi:hypothetical protein
LFSFFFEPFFLNDPVIDLNREIVTLEDELEAHQSENTVIKQDFSKRLASLRSQLQVTKTALARSVPTVERFLRALQLGNASHILGWFLLTVFNLILFVFFFFLFHRKIRWSNASKWFDC